MKEKEIITPDINIERLPIFHTLTREKGKEPLEIEHKRVVYDSDGNKKEMAIKVLSAGEYGLLRATDKKVFYYFLWKWQKSGQPDAEQKIYFTANDYFKATGIKGKLSTVHYKQFKEQVMRLRLTGIVLKDAYKTKDGHYISFEKPINLLTDAVIFERAKDVKSNQQYFQFSYVVINPIIIKSIKEKNIKLLRFDIVSRLKSEAALLLYGHIDLVMADKKVYERDIVELAEDIGITEKRVRRIKLLLKKAAKELEGKELTTGRIRKIEIQRSNTASGWKMRVEKGRHIKETQSEQERDEREYWLSVYNNLSAEEKAEVDEYVKQKLDDLKQLPGAEYREDEFTRECLITEYLSDKKRETR